MKMKMKKVAWAWAAVSVVVIMAQLVRMGWGITTGWLTEQWEK